MRDKNLLKILVFSIALLIVVSCATVLVAVSISVVSPSQVTLIPGETVTGELEDEGASDYYQVHVGSGEHLFVVLEDLSSLSDQNELYIKYGSLPNRTNYDDKFDIPNNPDQAVEINNTQAGYYYVLVYADFVFPSGGARYNITAYMTGMNNPPVASFNYSPKNPVVNQTITFNASSSYNPDGSITNYEWDFGDGNITNTIEPTITHFYAVAQDYIVNLTVTDDEGAMNSTNKTITVFPIAAGFDTGSPANPYPSIFGTHNGTIKPNQTITVQKLYTYPCSGTGGHSEHVRIWNDTWDGKDAYWKGYREDWRNITFDEPFTLFAGKAYYYEIRTGSYPQIIHKLEHTTLDGSFINCTKFIDANGKEYTDWIPAIQLWA